MREIERSLQTALDSRPWRTSRARLLAAPVLRHPMTSIVAVALLVRLVAALVVGGGFRFFDETEYVDTAQRLLAGQGFAAKYPKEPAYAVLLATLIAPRPGDLLYLRLAHAAVAAAGCVLVFSVGRRIFGETVALLAALCFALDPLSVVAAALLYPETFAALALLAVVLSALHAVDDDRLAWSAATGIWLGLLIQLRAVALVLPPVVMAWTMVAVRGVPLRRRVLHAVVIAATSALVLTPWTYRNYLVHGRLVAVSLSGSSNAPAPVRPHVGENGLATSMLQRIYDQPGAFVQRTLRELAHFWELSPSRLVTDEPRFREDIHEEDERLPTDPSFAPSLRDRVSAISFGLEMGFALLGVLVAARGKARETALLLALVLAYALGYSLFFSKLRYRITVLPEVFMFTGAGLALLWQAAARLATGAHVRAALRKESHS